MSSRAQEHVPLALPPEYMTSIFIHLKMSVPRPTSHPAAGMEELRGQKGFLPVRLSFFIQERPLSPEAPNYI